MDAERACKFPGCARKHYGRGMCSAHWQQWRRGQELTEIGAPKRTLTELFWAKVNKSGPYNVNLRSFCWLWTGGKLPTGYGVFKTRGESYAHRYAYKVDKGGSLETTDRIDHLCHNPSCVNPEHLRKTTNKQNTENRGRLNKNNSSGYRGVTWDKGTGTWSAFIRHNHKQKMRSGFKTAEEANEAAIKMRSEYFTHHQEGI